MSTVAPIILIALLWGLACAMPRNPHRLSFAADVAVWWRFGDSRDSATTVFDEIGTTDLTLVNMDSTNYVNV